MTNAKNPVPSQKFSRETVHQVMDYVCRVSCCSSNVVGHGGDQSQLGDYTLRRGTSEDMTATIKYLHEKSTTEPSNVNNPSQFLEKSILSPDVEFYCIAMVQENNHDDNLDQDDKRRRVLGWVTFSPAYSTWDGRYLSVHCIPPDQDPATTIWLLRTVAKVAVLLECQRLVWQHPSAQSTLYQSIGAEILHEYVTLRKRMDPPVVSSTSAHQHQGVLDPYRWVNWALAEKQILHNVVSSDAPVELHVATDQHLQYIETFVYRLASFANEVDAIHVDREHYQVDGGFVHKTNEEDGVADKPLYKCLLVWDKTKKQYCGMAFFFFGQDVSAGRYLYLEDLIIDEPFRGKGYGSLLMKTLSWIASNTGCSSFIWQSLDWNTPALRFYKQFGAEVLLDVVTTRFCGRTLQDFADDGHVSLENVGN